MMAQTTMRRPPRRKQGICWCCCSLAPLRLCRYPYGTLQVACAKCEKELGCQPLSVAALEGLDANAKAEAYAAEMKAQRDLN